MEFIGLAKPETEVRDSGEDVVDDFAFHIRQTKISPAVMERQLFVVQPHQMQNCRVKVMDVYFIFGRSETAVIR